mmetsp:Transcript_7484/g.15379  ORF Transcript_7484/g.15379 Transcript_7484/m.15379 type:complete len:629 (-) Transcript_7484:284-2170(-)
MVQIKEAVLGSGEGYDYKALCMPTLPYCGSRSKPAPPTTFYPLDEPLPLLLSLLMGLQHAFAMVGGLITPPYVVFRFTIDFANVELQQYAISAALITSGLCTLVNLAHWEIPLSKKLFGKRLYIGSGLLSVMGTSFTFLPIFEIAIGQMMDNDIDGTVAYGKMLGTSMVCAILELCFSLVPGKFINRMFPPVVCAVTVTLIGVALTGTGMKYWGGGVVCGDMIWKEHSQVVDLVGFDREVYPVSALPSAICENGKVKLPYGSAEYVGLGFAVLCFLVLIELFGSTFMKNSNVILALLFGYMVAGVSSYDDLPYVDSAKIKAAPVVDFLWTEWFGIGFYGPAVVPLLVAYTVTTVETIGDVTATHEVSELDVKSKQYPRRIQGSLSADALCSMLASLCTSMPNTTFSQNNGVIALTKCASRRAGFATAFWLILMGVFSKVAGIITSIPDCVLGGMTIFLFSNVLISGISLFGNLDLKSRRIRFISAMSLAVGVGVTVWPFAFQDMRGSSYTAAFWECADCNPTLQGFRNGVSIFLSTGYCVGAVIAILLNGILPHDPPVEERRKEKGEIHWSMIGDEKNAYDASLHSTSVRASTLTGQDNDSEEKVVGGEDVIREGDGEHSLELKEVTA